MKEASDNDSIDWNDDGDPPSNLPSESTLWGETRINDAIHEANQQQKDPAQFIQDKKSGLVEETDETEFRTVYQKKPKSLWQRLRSWVLKSD